MDPERLAEKICLSSNSGNENSTNNDVIARSEENQTMPHENNNNVIVIPWEENADGMNIESAETENNRLRKRKREDKSE